MDSTGPPSPVRIVAVLIWMLCRQPDLGICYVLSRPRKYHLQDCNVLEPECVVLLLAEWLREARVRAAVHKGLADLQDRHRCVADVFLVQSLLAHHIVQQDRRGLTVDLPQAILKYLQLWSHRPVATIVRDRLARLVWHRHTRRRFGVDLRREWMLCLTQFRVARDLTVEQIKTSVLFLAK